MNQARCRALAAAGFLALFVGGCASGGGVLSGPAMAGTLRVLSTLAVQGALPGLTAGFERSAGARVAVDFGPTISLLARIKSGEAADVAILAREGVDELSGLALLDGTTVVDLVQSLVGLAVKAGAAKPDIATPEALTRTLLQARSIAYSRIGASGIWFARLIERLGIADAVNARPRSSRAA